MLQQELDACNKLIHSPELLAERYRKFEYSQRAHDDNRLTLAEETSTIAPSAPPELSLKRKANVNDSPATLLAADINSTNLYQLVDEFLSGDNPNEFAVSSTPMSVLAPTPAPPVTVALMGKRQSTCGICYVGTRNNSCKLKACQACCAKYLEHCTVSPHAKLKGETHRADMITQIDALLAKPAAERNVFIGYCGTSGIPDNCRQIRIKSWHTLKVSIDAECLRNPNTPELKTFVLVRITRMELSAWN